MKKLLITGAAGFIGSNLTAKLLEDPEVEVIGFDNFDPFYPRERKEKNLRKLLTNPRFTFLEGDILNTADIEKVGKLDVIVHLAAKAGVRPSIQFPQEYLSVNVTGTQNLLEFAKNHHIRQFVFASSSSVYGINQNVPWGENEPLQPISPYAASKLAAEMQGHVYSHLYGIRFLALRFFTVYGPGQRPDLAIHQFFHRIANGEPITVYGDGRSQRDYTYIDDIVKGVCAAIDYTQSDFEIINLGNHRAITLADLITAIEDTCGRKALINRQPMQDGDVLQTFAQITKARTLLGYQPTTTLKQGLAAFYRWYQDNQQQPATNNVLV